MMKEKIISLIVGSFLLVTAEIASAASDNWRSLTPNEKDRVLENYQRWQRLPQQDKEHLREEWNRWQNLPQDRRDQLKRRYEEQRGRHSDD